MISIRNVTNSFGPQVVLRNVSLEIADGQTTAVVGPSGVGKSVLLKLIMGMLDPDHGEIWIGNDNMTAARSESERNAIRSRLGVLFQSAALFDSLTVYDNVAFPLLERTKLNRFEIHDKVVETLSSLSLSTYAYLYPEEIPLGVRKRVGMARSLITSPSILLFDEPNTGLDPLVGQEVYDLIKESRAKWGFTAIVISHEIPEVFQVSDRVAMLLNGEILAEGTPEELCNHAHPAVQQFLNGRRDGPIQIQ